MEIVRCTEEDYETLAGIWERSVIATHNFLKEEDFNEIKAALIPDYFPNVDLYAIADKGAYVGFIGLSPDTIEMLFIDDAVAVRAMDLLSSNLQNDEARQRSM